MSTLLRLAKRVMVKMMAPLEQCAFEMKEALETLAALKRD